MTYSTINVFGRDFLLAPIDEFYPSSWFDPTIDQSLSYKEKLSIHRRYEQKFDLAREIPDSHIHINPDLNNYHNVKPFKIKDNTKISEVPDGKFLPFSNLYYDESIGSCRPKQFYTMSKTWLWKGDHLYAIYDANDFNYIDGPSIGLSDDFTDQSDSIVTFYDFHQISVTEEQASSQTVFYPRFGRTSTLGSIIDSFIEPEYRSTVKSYYYQDELDSPPNSWAVVVMTPDRYIHLISTYPVLNYPFDLPSSKYPPKRPPYGDNQGYLIAEEDQQKVDGRLICDAYDHHVRFKFSDLRKVSLVTNKELRMNQPLFHVPSKNGDTGYDIPNTVWQEYFPSDFYDYFTLPSYANDNFPYFIVKAPNPRTLPLDTITLQVILMGYELIHMQSRTIVPGSAVPPDDHDWDFMSEPDKLPNTDDYLTNDPPLFQYIYSVVIGYRFRLNEQSYGPNYGVGCSHFSINYKQTVFLASLSCYIKYRPSNFFPIVQGKVFPVSSNDFLEHYSVEPGFDDNGNFAIDFQKILPERENFSWTKYYYDFNPRKYPKIRVGKSYDPNNCSLEITGVQVVLTQFDSSVNPTNPEMSKLFAPTFGNPKDLFFSI